MDTKYLIIFVHIEKCGGTSLLASSRRRKGLRHCDIISSKKLGNVASVDDFSLSLNIYKNCDFITGHCLYPKYIDAYKKAAISKGYEPIFITSIRNPVSRLLSDYAHACRRGEKILLSQYIEIPFKKNYLCNFFGDGVYDDALAQLKKIDYVVKLSNFDSFVRYLNQKYKLNLYKAVYSNSSEVGDFPDDLRVTDGVRIGKYSIDQEVYTRLLGNNSRDIFLLENINYWESDERYNPELTVEIDVAKTKHAWAWVYRNFWYKPKIQHCFGHVFEKRNSVPHPSDGGVEYMWGDEVV